MIQLKNLFKVNAGPIITLIMGLVVLVSYLSGYNLTSPYVVNYDIATMLTPIGLLKNYILKETYLTPYYMNVPNRPELADNIKLYVTIFVLQLSVVILLIKLKKKN